MKDWFKHLWCRVAYGHIMIPYGNDGDEKVGPRGYAWYMCARCLFVERLHCIGRNKDAE